MGVVAVISASGKPLMPTNSRRARRLLKSGRAEIETYRPYFTIRLTDREDGLVQPVECKFDTDYEHIGISVCSEKHEFVNEQRDLLPDEVENHKSQGKTRRARRNKKRYREKRFDNRKGRMTKDGFTPSLRNKRDQHVNLYREICKVFPVSAAIFEMGQFDTQALKAMEEGKLLPEGKDYQQGERYKTATLREAVFTRDKHTCVFCKRSIKDGAVLHVHHIGYWKQDRTNRLSNLATCCEKCHTAKNHQPGGKLYGVQPKLSDLKGATFMTAIRWDMLKRIKKAVRDVDVSVTYGAATKLARQELKVKKSHANDAYCMGDFHPKHRTDFKHYQKRRRNNRTLEKFYDAWFIDVRDGKKKKGAQLSCGRNNRREPRMSDKNERVYRGPKISKGYRSIRKGRHPFQKGAVVLYNNKKYICRGVQNNGTRVLFQGVTNSVSAQEVRLLIRPDGWVLVPDEKEPMITLVLRKKQPKKKDKPKKETKSKKDTPRLET